MFSGLFGWLRASVKAAVLGGVRDAITELQLVVPSEEVEVPRLTLTHQVAEPAEEPAGKRRKAGA